MTLARQVREINRREGGVPFVLAADFAFFLALIVAYLVVRINSPIWPRPFHFPSGLMTISMLMFLGAASFVMFIATRMQAKRDDAMAQRMIALVLVGWFAFIFLLILEWARLFLGEHVTLLSNPWHVPLLGLVYYGLTAYLAAHIAAGTVWLVLASQALRKYSLRSLSLLVHFTTAVFLVIAFFVIFSSTDLEGF
jgi:heme/copper-type cytochrome/quinol oxidase subunit 3